MKCMNNERKEAYQVRKILKKLEETLRIKIGVRWECLGEKKRELLRKRSKEMSCGSHEEIILAHNKSRQMQVSRGIETAVEEGIEEIVIDRYRYQRGVEEQPIRCKNRSLIDPPAVEMLSRKQELSRSIHQVSRSYWDCDTKSLRSLIDSKVSRGCQGGVELAFKSNFFKKWKTQTWM